MSLIQFFRIFWARRWLIVAATVSCLIGALIVTALLPPRWEAHSRVMLNLLKPDPITGQVIAAQGGQVYAATQIELITDSGIAGQVAEQLGWLTDPNLQAAYQKRSKNDQRDFRSWLSQIIVDNTKARLIQGSNILEISYTGTSAANAKAVADVLRKVYIQDSLLTRREDAERNAEWFEQQAAKAKTALDQAIEVETAFERANGVVMANDKIDTESARLQAMSGSAGVATSMPYVPPASTPAQTELSAINSQIAVSSKVLGPNNPEMQALHTRRTAIAALAAKEASTVRSVQSGANSTQGAFERAVAAQKARIIADSPKIGRLTQLQNDVDLRRGELEKLSEKVAQYRQEAVVSDPGLTPLGPPSTPKGPSFPNYTLLIPGSIILGAALGVLVALLMELLGRRVRGADDLTAIHDLPLVGVIGSPKAAARTGWRTRLPRLNLGSRKQKALTA